MSQPSSAACDPMEIARGFMESRILLTAVELGVFAEIERGRRTAARLADALGTDARGMERLLNALTGIGLMAKDGDGRFSNTEEGRRSLLPDSPESMVDALRHYAYLWTHWSPLTEVVRTGNLAKEDAGEWSGDQVDAFIGAMACFARVRAPMVAKTVDLTDAKRLLDIGGGPATYSIEFCKRYPELTAVVFDAPEVVPIAERHIAEAGMSGRITTQAGDYNTDDFGKGFDVALIFSVLHINSPEQNRRLLARTFAALGPGGRVIIQEFLVNDAKTAPPWAAIFGINMLVNTEGGDVYSESEVRAWLGGAGFAACERLEIAELGADLLAARKPGE
ncbi:MAG: methyltransferase [Planctomycetota bacterium]